MSVMTLTNARRILRARYGLEYSTTEDPLYAQSFLNEVINDGHYWFAGLSRCYYDPNLSVAVTSGVASYALPSTVVRPDERTFRIQISAAYTRLPARNLHSLLEQWGPLESVASATPQNVFMHGGTVSGASKKAVLVPSPNANATLWFGAWVYPAALSADSDLFPLDDPDVYRMVPAWCMKLAEFDYSRGRADANLVQMWTDKATQAAAEFEEIIRTGTREFQRTAEVGATALEDAAERRRSRTVRGS